MNEADKIRSARDAVAQGDFAQAIALYQPLAEAGVVEAQYELGCLALTECELVTGREAFKWFELAARNGHAAAMYHLATFPEFITEGFSSPLSNDERWEFLLASANAGHVQAQYDAGAYLATGDWYEGLTPDLSAAVGWYRKAAEAGHAEAQFNLALMLFGGEGCDRDTAEGLRWLNAAIAQGDEDAARLLGEIGERGVEDVFPNRP